MPCLTFTVFVSSSVGSALFLLCLPCPLPRRHRADGRRNLLCLLLLVSGLSHLPDDDGRQFPFFSAFFYALSSPDKLFPVLFLSPFLRLYIPFLLYTAQDFLYFLRLLRYFLISFFRRLCLLLHSITLTLFSFLLSIFTDRASIRRYLSYSVFFFSLPFLFLLPTAFQGILICWNHSRTFCFQPPFLQTAFVCCFCLRKKKTLAFSPFSV